MEPFTGADLQRLAAEGDEEIETLWSKALIIGFAKGYDAEDVLDMPLEDIFAEEE